MEPIVSDVRGCEGKGSNFFCHSSLATHTKGHSCLEENRSKNRVFIYPFLSLCHFHRGRSVSERYRKGWQTEGSIKKQPWVRNGQGGASFGKTSTFFVVYQGYVQEGAK
jgi:hypothetical protein